MTREQCRELAELLAGDDLPVEVRVASLARILEIVYALGRAQGATETAFELMHKREDRN